MRAAKILTKLDMDTCTFGAIMQGCVVGGLLLHELLLCSDRCVWTSQEQWKYRTVPVIMLLHSMFKLEWLCCVCIHKRI